MNRKLRLLLSTLICLGVLILSSCDDDDDNGNDSAPDQNIVELVQDTDDLSTLEAALTKFPDLVTTLSGDGEFTVFAPTNAAFENLLEAVGQTSLDDIPDDVLREILEYHVIAGSSLESNELTAGDVETAGGEEISVDVSSGVTLNGTAAVTMADVRATNGVVHIIDEVLIPPSMAPIVGTVVAPAYFNKNFTTLVAAVKAASPAIMQALLNSNPKTLFLPTNQAFIDAGITTIPDQPLLDAVLTYHVISAAVMSADIAPGSSEAETLGGYIYLSKIDDGIFINGISKVTTADISASNGVVHVIDRTLIPTSQTLIDIVMNYSFSEPPEFTQLAAALMRTEGQGANDLYAELSDDNNLTMFAPTDAAFQEIYTALGVSGVDDVPLDVLIAVLKHHVVVSRFFSTDLVDGMLSSLYGVVTINASANPPTITGGSGGSNVATLQPELSNLNATNGVIHGIDKVLLP